MKKKIKINRAPVLTLWAAVVAERLGHDREAALTLGRAVAGLNAQSKGRRLGIYEETEAEKETREKKEKTPLEVVPVLGRAVPVTHTEAGLRALEGDEPIDPAMVNRYLHGKFGDSLDDVRAAMEALAASFQPKQLATRAYALYEKFRPDIPEGTAGWGAAGELDLDYIRSLAPRTKERAR